MTLAVPAEHETFMFSETMHYMWANCEEEYQIELTILLLINLGISLQLQRKRS